MQLPAVEGEPDAELPLFLLSLRLLVLLLRLSALLLRVRHRHAGVQSCPRGAILLHAAAPLPSTARRPAARGGEGVRYVGALPREEASRYAMRQRVVRQVD